MLKGRASKDTLSDCLLYGFSMKNLRQLTFTWMMKTRSIMEASESAKKKPLLRMDEVL